MYTKEQAQTRLAVRMIEFADSHNLPEDHQVRVKAAEFEVAALDYWLHGKITVQAFCKAWTSANSELYKAAKEVRNGK